MSNAKDEIILRGLKANNLKNIDLNIKKEQITVFTGISGSGKSSVVFDTLATESRRQMTMIIRCMFVTKCLGMNGLKRIY